MADIWTVAAQASAVVHKAEKVSRLKAARDDLAGKCGSCAKWITSACPREINRLGRKYGPSCDDRVCPYFREAYWVAEKRARIDAELASLSDDPS